MHGSVRRSFPRFYEDVLCFFKRYDSDTLSRRTPPLFTYFIDKLVGYSLNSTPRGREFYNNGFLAAFLNLSGQSISRGELHMFWLVTCAVMKTVVNPVSLINRSCDWVILKFILYILHTWRQISAMKWYECKLSFYVALPPKSNPLSFLYSLQNLPIILNGVGLFLENRWQYGNVLLSEVDCTPMRNNKLVSKWVMWGIFSEKTSSSA